jgi:hypothetical protein
MGVRRRVLGIAAATAISGRALSSEFILAPDQLRAIRKFARIVLPPALVTY